MAYGKTWYLYKLLVKHGISIAAGETWHSWENMAFL